MSNFDLTECKVNKKTKKAKALKRKNANDLHYFIFF